MPRYLGLLLVCLSSLAVTACANQQSSKDSASQSANRSTSTTLSSSAPLPHVMLGVRMAAAGPALAKHLGVHPNDATLVTYVAPDTPARQAGLEDWDVIVKVNGSPDASPKAIRALLRSSKPGDKVEFSVRRGDKTNNISVELEAADHERMVPLPTRPSPTSR